MCGSIIRCCYIRNRLSVKKIHCNDVDGFDDNDYTQSVKNEEDKHAN
ncbi:MAG: hypothetical protein PWP38_667 [Clostridiales bacterium]|jgi:hypothetical protein|nr:hypothetical protein [Clostridiales bacterium]